jgi:hypothetical protein
VVAFTHYPPADQLGAQRLRAATVAWSGLLDELHAVGFRPYLELEMGEADDSLRLFCELSEELLLDLSLGDQGLPDAPPPANEIDWTVFVQSASDGYLAEVMIDPSIDFQALTGKLRELVDAVAAGERPFLAVW